MDKEFINCKRKCPNCNQRKWRKFLKTSTSRVMTSDQRILNGDLNKIICDVCGVVANHTEFSDEEILQLYGEDYKLNTSGGEEHYFFTTEGSVARSEIYYEWIIPHFPNNFSSLLEIGCGEGNVLKRLKKKFPDKKISGIDGSEVACKIARTKGLDVSQKLLVASETDMDKSDIIISIGVLEHVEKIDEFIGNILSILNKDGHIVFCLPIQDYKGYDVFFVDHVWHLTVKQCSNILNNNGLEIIHHDCDHPVNHGFGLFVCKKNEKVESVPLVKYENNATLNRNIWLAIFNKVDIHLNKLKKQRIAIFGSGEVATLLLTYTLLSNSNINMCIDEDKSKIGKEKHGMPIVSMESLLNSEVDNVILTINPQYHQLVTKKLDSFKITTFSYNV